MTLFSFLPFAASVFSLVLAFASPLRKKPSPATLGLLSAGGALLYRHAG